MFAPDDANLVYAVTRTATKSNRAPNIAGCLPSVGDAGSDLDNAKFFGNQNPLWHVAVGPLEPNGKRRVYAVGNCGRVVFEGRAGRHGSMDLGVNRQINNDPAGSSAPFQVGNRGGNGVGGFGGANRSLGAAMRAQILAVDPSNPAKVFLATTGGALTVRPTTTRRFRMEHSLIRTAGGWAAKRACGWETSADSS